jgi:RNA polymerase sigma factor FliA
MNSMTASTPPPAPRRALTRADYDRFQPLVRRLAMRAARRVPSHIKAQDLMGYGWLGLVEAFSRAEATMADEEFEAYASYRIRGAMLDYLRSLDPMARALRSRSRHVSRAIADLTKSLGRQPEEEEIAKALGMELDAYRETLSDIGKAGMARLELLDLDKVDLVSEAEAPDEEVSRQGMAGLVAGAIDKLPERLRQLLALYYQEECTLREIGLVLGVTESRVSQLHTEAIHRLRAALRRE